MAGFIAARDGSEAKWVAEAGFAGEGSEGGGASGAACSGAGEDGAAGAGEGGGEAASAGVEDPPHPASTEVISVAAIHRAE
jgi:hypothetical protein